MQYSIIFIGASAFAAFAAAQAPNSPLFFSTMPKQDEKLLIGEPISLDFKAPKPDPVKITLLRGAPLNNYPYKVLSAAATGATFSFTPDSSYPIACDYGLQIDQDGSAPNYSTHFCLASPDTPSGKEDVSTSTSVSGGITRTTHITTVITSTVTSTTTTPTGTESVDTTCTTDLLPSSTVTTYSAPPVYGNSSIPATSVGIVGPSGSANVPSSIIVATPVVTPIATPIATPTAGPTAYTPGSGAASLAASGLVAGVVAVCAAMALL